MQNVVKNKSTSSTPDIKSIIKETNVKQHREENEKKKRETNIVIHGVPENNFNSKEEEFEWNENFSKRLMADLNLPNYAKNLYRLGKMQEGKI